MRALLLLLLVTLDGRAAAQVSEPPILLALRQQSWARAQVLAAAEPDPLAAKLVTFIRLLSPGQAGAAELQAFLAANPGWPDQDMLARRYGEALALEPDGRLVASLCTLRLPGDPAGLLRCADAWTEAGAEPGNRPRAVQSVRTAWVALPPDAALEADLLARWGSVLTRADQWARFERLEGASRDDANRQLARLPPDDRLLGAARLAFRHRDPDAMATLAAVPERLRADPALLLAEARALRRADADAAALALWQTALPAAEAATPQDRRGPFWVERDALARRLLAGGDARSAYQLSDDQDLLPDQAVEQHFLAGWIALRRLHDSRMAAAQFRALAGVTHAAITQARAHYWLSRCQADPAAARAELALAAAWPTTYYGQLAARAAGQSDAAVLARIATLHDPAATKAETQALAATDLVRAATILAGWDDPRRAADFLRRLLQPPATDVTRSLVAALSLRLGVPDMAVAAARLAGRDGAVLARSGWPMPVQPPVGAVPRALVLALIRQESSFDPQAASPAGAHGLMQLMPATAAATARPLHAPAGPLADPEINMRLGTAYLGTLLASFDGSHTYAVAAYNAGPRRVHDWIAANGDVAHDPDLLIDWIELIPFGETRNYVQRVLENEVIYRAFDAD